MSNNWHGCAVRKKRVSLLQNAWELSSKWFSSWEMLSASLCNCLFAVDSFISHWGQKPKGAHAELNGRTPATCSFAKAVPLVSSAGNSVIFIAALLHSRLIAFHSHYLRSLFAPWSSPVSDTDRPICRLVLQLHWAVAMTTAVWLRTNHHRQALYCSHLLVLLSAVTLRRIKLSVTVTVSQ